jgi:hypothetical protein
VVGLNIYEDNAQILNDDFWDLRIVRMLSESKFTELKDYQNYLSFFYFHYVNSQILKIQVQKQKKIQTNEEVTSPLPAGLRPRLAPVLNHQICRITFHFFIMLILKS